MVEVVLVFMQLKKNQGLKAKFVPQRTHLEEMGQHTHTPVSDTNAVLSSARWHLPLPFQFTKWHFQPWLPAPGYEVNFSAQFRACWKTAPQAPATGSSPRRLPGLLATSASSLEELYQTSAMQGKSGQGMKKSHRTLSVQERGHTEAWPNLVSLKDKFFSFKKNGKTVWDLGKLKLDSWSYLLMWLCEKTYKGSWFSSCLSSFFPPGLWETSPNPSRRDWKTSFVRFKQWFQKLTDNQSGPAGMGGRCQKADRGLRDSSALLSVLYTCLLISRPPPKGTSTAHLTFSMQTVPCASSTVSDSGEQSLTLSDASYDLGKVT